MINNLSQRACNLEYGINKIGTLVIFCPAISLITYKMKTADLYAKINNAFQRNPNLGAFICSGEQAQLDKISKWHALGSSVQMISFVALGVLLNPIFLLPSFCAMYEAYSSSSFFRKEYVYRNGQWTFN